MIHHPSEQELSAHLDHALPDIESMRIDAHAASCAVCRETLARLSALDRSLREQRTHDPGNEYFETFADRVETRIRAAGLAGAQSQEDRELKVWNWLRTPSGLSWIGAAAAVVIGAGVALITSREMQMQNLHRPEWTDHVTDARDSDDKSGKPDESRSLARSDAPAPAPAAGGGNDQKALRELNAKEEAAKPQSAYEVRRNAAGDEVPVNPPRGFAAPPQASSKDAAGTGGAVYADKARRAEPMGAGAPGVSAQAGSNAPASAAAPLDAEKKSARASNQVGTTDELSSIRNTRHCGSIRDPRGGAIANAQVMVAETGTSVSSAADGAFCIDVPPAGRTLVVMAVGYEPRREPVEPGVQGNLDLALHPVAVLEGGYVTQTAKLSSGAAPSLAPAPPSAQSHALKQAPGIPGMISDSVSAMMATAMRVETDAARAHSATQYEAAAVQWEKVLRNVKGAPAENGIRFRVAQARYNAWLNEPAKSRADAANASILAYVARAPEGAERDLAQRWLEHLSGGSDRAGSH
jgi:Carboxypeptidase regulatory-like domain/Putative zinc-finger